ncbi:MAG: hypothetical protein U0R26_11705 [Solirubrobacterales bacterium]
MGDGADEGPDLAHFDPVRGQGGEEAGGVLAPEETMFVSTGAGSIDPSIAASAAARTRALAWSSASRSTLWSRA